MEEAQLYIVAQLGPLMCWCCLLCWDAAIEAQSIGGNQSLCSLCKTEESSWRLRVCSSAIDVESLPHDEIYDRIILSHQSAVSGLHKHELMIILHLILNEKIWIRNSIWEKSFWHVTSYSVCVLWQIEKLDSAHRIWIQDLCIFHLSLKLLIFFFFIHCTTHSNAKRKAVRFQFIQHQTPTLHDV